MGGELVNRTLSAAIINELANAPTIRPWMGGAGDLDLTGQISDPNNFAFVSDDDLSALFFHKIGLGLYDFHVITGTASKSLYRDMEATFRTMFVESDAIEVVCRLPDGNAASAKWAKWLGFREVERREGVFDLMGDQVGCCFGSLTFSDWIRHNALDWTVELLECVTFGNLGKGVGLYNRHAAMLGEPQVIVRATQPAVLEIDGVMIEVGSNGAARLLPARSAKPQGLASCPLPQSLAQQPH